MNNSNPRSNFRAMNPAEPMSINNEDIKRFKVFLRDKDKKNLIRILKEFIYLSAHKKEVPLYYFKHLYKKEVKNILDYISTGEVARIHADPYLHKPELTSIMNNKLAFALFARTHGIPTPRLYGYQFGPSFFRGKEVLEVFNLEDLHAYFDSIFRNSSQDRLFIKPMSDFGGKGCFILRKDLLREELSEKEQILKSGRHLFYEVVTQHEKLDAINRHSLNTLRIVSYITDAGNLEFISNSIRFGVGKSPVDNAAAGGITVGVNPEKGTLLEVGYRKMSYGVCGTTHHPNTNFKFGGFKIPFFEESLDLIARTLQLIPDRLIGWDIAISPKGPLIIEANDTPGFYFSEIAQAGLLRNPVSRELVSKYK